MSRGGTNIAVSELGLHLGGVCLPLAMRREAPAEHLKGRVKCDLQFFRDRVQTQAQPIVWMNRCRQWPSCTRLHPWEHEGISVRVRTPLPPQVNRLTHGLGDRDKAVIGASVTMSRNLHRRPK